MIDQLTLADTELELAISFEIDRCMLAETKEERVDAIERACELHKMRTPHAIAVLERHLGLKK